MRLKTGDLKTGDVRQKTWDRRHEAGYVRHNTRYMI